MKMGGLVSTDDAKAVIAGTLNMFVGRGRWISWGDLAAATGDKEGTLRSYAAEDPHLMPLDAVLRVFAVLPPAALNRVTALIGLSVSPAEVDDVATLRGATVGTALFVARATEALADGTISPREKAQLADEAAALLPQLHAIAGGKK